VKEINPIDALRAFVAQHGTQQAVAKILGVSEPFVTDMLRGRRNIPDRVLLAIGARRIVVRDAQQKAS